MLEVGDDTVTLASTPEARLPGRYALWVGEELLRLGQPVSSTSLTVEREIDAEGRRMLQGVTDVAFSGYWLSEPEQLGLPVEEVNVATEHGPAPAWVLGEQTGATWSVHIHGRATTRREVLRGIRPFAERGIPSIALSYRNDGEAPRSKDGRYRLGLDEWEDVDAAIDLAVSRGAERIVVFGWSMGGAIALKLARKSRHRRRIAALVLDSPVARWEPTLRLQTGALGLPEALVHSATRILESQFMRLRGSEALRFGDVDAVRHAGAYVTPMLLLHSEDDGYVPPDASRELAQARPDLVEYIEWKDALHTKLWNFDPERYEREIGGFLDRHGLAG